MSAAPLAGLTVVDLSRLLPGPLAARLLADLGARVIKVEEPSLGDPVRLAPPRRGADGALGSLLLAGVESIALDLKSPEARDVLDRLLAGADVMLDTLRPGTLERLGLAPAALAERYPRLVVCSLTGWGQGGPWAARAGHDLTYQAAAGSLAPTGGMPAVPVADVAGAWCAVASILAALHERHDSGRGGRIDAALFDAAVHANLTAWAEEAGGPRAVGEALPLSGELPCYGLYETAGGTLLAVAALEPHFWHRLCHAAGAPELEARQYSRDPADRLRVAAMIKERSAGQWAELAAEHDLPVEPVRSAAAAAAHPQAEHRGVLDRGADGLPRLAFPALFDGARPRAAERVPRLGGDTGRLLEELGMEMGLLRRFSGGVGRRFSLKRVLARWVGR